MAHDEPKILLSKKQSKEFAIAIFADIALYVENHREEFENFIKEKNNSLEVKK